MMKQTTILRVFLTVALVHSSLSFSFRVAPKARSFSPASSSPSIQLPKSRCSATTSSCLRQSAATGDSSIQVDDDGKKSPPISAAVFNLVKACCGSGVLALPAGLAVMSDRKAATLPASILICATGAMSAYTFQVLGRLCERTGASGLGDVWERIMGKHSWIIDLCTIVTCIGVSLTYSIVLGDFLSDILQNRVSREACIVGITMSCLYPLARLPTLDALAPVSKMGVYGTFFACAVLIFRCTLSGAYKLAPVGRFLKSVPALPTFATRSGPINPLSTLVLVSIAAQSFLCHFTAPEFFESIQKSMPTYNKVTIYGFAVTALINIAFMTSGFLTFGGASAGVILNSYSNQDVLVSICRLLMAVSVVGGFPFMIRGTLSAMYSMFNIQKDNVSKANQQRITAALVTSVTLPALVVRNAGLVVSLNGALMGSAITYIFPAILFLKSDLGKRSERLWMKLVLAWGITASLVGGGVSILSEYAPHLLR